MASPDDAVSRLKAATDDLHQTLDRHSRMSRLVAPDLALEEYADILRRLLACHAEIEPVLDAFRQAQPEPQAWINPAIYRRSPLLRADLQALGPWAASPGPAAEPTARPQGGVEVSSVAEAAGCMYVLAGASLGARVIERRVRECLGASVASALRYFSPPDGPEAWSWPAYRQGLNEILREAAQEREAQRAARSVFACFVHHLQRGVLLPSP